ncbi:L-threonylcarbamoyladenylate synthase [Aliifodinibius sp. S!AR15-10]|uniref:L-threonylcarbamoyladenylate synthase n=1 Tax=Aliifodinibius sp. S!AR15-10 TaxID=2950437 RepID=UPI002862380E|nr:L-threonylcarbamoyladenylate synthase [Aliifodinibius sp. S!AR15-10]MDR8390149.1 L-threonylcarbamoyladenylate synthase [Aliifodinibius sp. S!AR15-10]
MNVSIEKAIELLESGEPVAFPTETVYGLGADAWNPGAIKKVFEIKGRPSDNPLIVHIASKAMVNDFATEIPEAAVKLMDACWPGPLTLIFRKKPEVLDLITAGLDTVALRWPSHALAQELIFRAGPLVAPSANTSGRPSPTKASHVTEDFGNDFPVIDGGATQIGLESTVLDISEQPFRIYRPGFIDKSKIEKITGEEVILQKKNTSGQETRSPGTKYSHYAPEAVVRWLEEGETPDQKNALYLLHSLEGKEDEHHIHYHQNFQQMASELYDRFRQADHQQLDTIIIEPFDERARKEHPITEALLNRITKAVGG